MKRVIILNKHKNPIVDFGLDDNNAIVMNGVKLEIKGDILVCAICEDVQKDTGVYIKNYDSYLTKKKG